MNNQDKKSGNSKLKYHEQQLQRELDINRVVNVPGKFPSTKNNQNSNIDVETYLLHPLNNYSRKEQMILDTDEENNKKEYRNFKIDSNTKRNNLDFSEYVKNGYMGNGRGFGDIEASAHLRYGFDTRHDKKTANSHDITEFKINHVYHNFHDPKHNVLPFARGGIDTRNLDKYRK